MNPPRQPDDPVTLRRAAEARLKARPARDRLTPLADVRRLQHEMEVQQIELETQNAELLASRSELAAGLERYTDLFDFAPVGYFNLTTDGTICLANLTAAALVGHERSRLAGCRFVRLVAETDRRKFNDFLAQVFAAAGRQNCELTLSPEGRPSLVVHVGATRSADGRECRATLIDITQRKTSELVQRQSEERFGMIVESLKDHAILMLDPDGRVATWNRVAERITGFTGAEITGEHCSRFHTRRDVERGAPGRELAVAAESGLFDEEALRLRKDGSEFMAQVTISALRNEAGQLRGFLKILRDITERTRVAVLRASREQLRALASRIQAVREEERAHAAREIHDVLAQELTGLKLEISWLSRRLTEPMDRWQPRLFLEKLAAMPELADKAGHSAQRIATDLRPIVLDSLGLCAAIEWVAADFQKRTAVHCEVVVPRTGMKLDPKCSTALFRILQESLTNVTRHARASQVKIHLRREADEVVMTVRDNGRGVQADELSNPLSLGLLGMRERATLLGGSCAVRAEAGGGTTVEVRLLAASIR